MEVSKIQIIARVNNLNTNHLSIQIRGIKETKIIKKKDKDIKTIVLNSNNSKNKLYMSPKTIITFKDKIIVAINLKTLMSAEISMPIQKQ